MSSFVINGWHNISLIVKRDFGSRTNIFFMKSLASSGTEVFFYYSYKYRKIVLAALYSLICHLYLVSLKRRPPIKKSETNHTSWPNVHLVRMAHRPLDDLWRNVVWSAAHCSLLLICKLQLRRQPKISNFHLHILT